MLISQIRAFIEKYNLMQPNATVVVGLSGGPDSVFLLVVLEELRKQGVLKRVIAGHLDHQWREHSHRDAEFCITIAARYNVELVSATLQDLPLPPLPKGSKEEQGRVARRFFLSQLADQYQAQSIALAHHRDDQQETFFIRLMRGASLSGLVGMRPQHGRYIRPLLELSKQDIIAHLDQHDIPYLTDPSNLWPEFLRNRIRMTAIPALRACDARFDQSFSRTLSSLQETEDFLEQVAQQTFDEIAHFQDNVYYLDIKKFCALHMALQRRLIVLWLCRERVTFPVSTGFFAEVLKFLHSAGDGSHNLHLAWSMVKRREFVHIQKH